MIQLADSSGTVTKAYRYDAYGVEKEPDKGDQNSFRYCGEYYDKETGSIYLRARYYEPRTGRFRNEDSYRGQDKTSSTLNLYTYCLNNPIQYKDSSGNIAVVDDAILIYMGATLVLTTTISWLETPEGQVFLRESEQALQSAAMEIYQVAEDGAMVLIDAGKFLTGSKTINRSAISAGTLPGLEQLDKSEEKAKGAHRIQTDRSSNTIVLANIKAKQPASKDKVYQLAYVNTETGALIKFGNKMTYAEAVAALTVTAGGNLSSEIAEKARLSHPGYWGIYTNNQAHACALAEAFGAVGHPEVHGSGFYGHYHDKKHWFHVWYGGQKTY